MSTTTTRGPRLYLVGHNHKRGHAVALELVDAPPLRYVVNLRKARTLVRRFNRAAEARERIEATPASPAAR